MSRTIDDNVLPWEHNGPPRGVGVCLSGGGLRAASFALGVVQALQQDRGLLYGRTSADYLAVVSGGSYLGASDLLNARQMLKATSPPASPLHEGSPEEKYIVSHGDYLKRLGTATKMALGGVVNVAAFIAIFAWTGVMMSAVIAVATEIGVGSLSGSGRQLIAAGVFVVGARTLLRGLYLDGGLLRLALPVIGGGLVLVTAPSTLAAMRRAAPLSQAGWWSLPKVLLVVAGAGLLVGLSVGLARSWPQGLPARLSVWFAARIPALAGAVLFCLLATGFARSFERAVANEGGELYAGTILFIALLGAAIAQILARTSLHGMYRDSLSKCFSVIRSAGGVQLVGPTERKLSDLAPPERPSAKSFPRLLVCATANVIWDPDDPSASGITSLLPHKRRKFASFVYSHDRCGLPGVDEASFATKDLERLTARAGIPPGREPLVSLMTAVASAGAAVSPAMGRKTSDLFRPLIALANLRLGRWLPNPLSSRIRELVTMPDADKQMGRKRGIGGAYDEFVPELFGLHHSDAARIYISDGGHYDNLGLTTLLQARCKEIWCVDAQADPWGKASQLCNVLQRAEETLDVEIDIDLDGFAGSVPGVLGQASASGTITYSDGTLGQLEVIKLGLTEDSDVSLRNYQAEDEGFPYHGTFWPPFRVMWYGPTRFDSYRRVGYANGLHASQSKRDREEAA